MALGISSMFMGYMARQGLRMKILAMDIETDALDATKIHVICAQDVDTNEKYQFLNVCTIPEEREAFYLLCQQTDKFVFHNGIGFDVKVINKLLNPLLIAYPEIIKPTDVIDTLIMSRLIDYSIKGGHSLKAWGQRLGEFKIGFDQFEVLTQEMIDYCHQDVEVTVRLYNKFKSSIFDPDLQDAIKCEHDIQILCEEMTDAGFYFEKDKAEHLLDEVELRMIELTESFQRDFPPQLEEVNRIKYRKKKDGTVMSSVKKAQEKYFKTTVDWSANPPDLVCYDWIEFNPASPKMRIERLWEAGWQPYEKTKGHIQYDREQKQRSWR
jgi:hypothetical protein